MSAKRHVLWVLAALLALSCGCVERKMLIRSDPSGAPVWIDEKSVGTSPVDYTFIHYGRRRIRVGPIRDEEDKVAYPAVEREVEIVAPWYQKFPTDFFFEVLYPRTLVDEHEIRITLTPAAELPPGKEGEAEILDRAEEFREGALAPPPELE